MRELDNRAATGPGLTRLAGSSDVPPFNPGTSKFKPGNYFSIIINYRATQY